MQARDARLLAAIEGGLGELGILHSLTVVDAPPVVGAALRALDTLGAAPQAYARLRSELAAYDQLAEVAHG